MLKKRIIPCLDIQNGRTVKGVNFVGIRDAGDPVELARKYAKDGADELGVGVGVKVGVMLGVGVILLVGVGVGVTSIS